MKKIKDGEIVIETPWLSAAEAALYCNMSVQTFQRHARRSELTKSIRGNRCCYHTGTLDRFLEGNPEKKDTT